MTTDIMWLNIVWYVLFVVIIAGYLIMDGFDLGVGILHPFLAKNDQERRISLNSIGPVWDGNEVWLVLGGGVLFAAFPMVYASLFSGFYSAMMLVLLVLILRTVAIEFRSKRPAPSWRQAWDWVFFASSLGIALLLGVAFGNIMQGVELDADGNIHNNLISLLNPYALLVGVDDGLHVGDPRRDLPEHEDRRCAAGAGEAVAAAADDRLLRPQYLLVGATVFLHETIADRYLQQPVLVIIPAVALLAVIVAWFMVRRARYFVAFLFSSAMIAGLLFSAAVGLLSEPARLDFGCPVQSDDLQRRLAAQHADGHARHRRDRHALCAAVHGGGLLFLPRQGAARVRRAINGLHRIWHRQEP